MTRKYTTMDFYSDEYPIPHRRLTNQELHLLFNTVEYDQVEGFYLQADNLRFQARERADQQLTEITDGLKNDPRFAELESIMGELLNGPKEDTPEAKKAWQEHRGAVWAEHRQLLAPKVEAEKELLKAKDEYNRLMGEKSETVTVLAYLAGQRDGLRLGIKIASLLMGGSPVAGMDHSKASLLVAGAMVDDGQADSVIDVMLRTGHQVSSGLL